MICRRPHLSLLVALAAAVACHKGSSGPSLRLAEPSAVAVVRAFGHLHPDLLWSYAFVANTEQNELIVFDAVEDRVVPAPILLRPLSISTPDPRPALVAATDFWEATDEADAPSPRPGLLVVVSAGATQLQLVRTWLDANATDPGLPADGPVELGGPVLALLATPAVDGAGNKVADRARVVAALADGRLAVVEYEWSGDPTSSDPVTGGKVTRVGTGPAALQDLGFEALSLAVDPRDPRYLFAASVDEIEGVEGVARFDMSGAVGSWDVAALDAGGPTRLVAALTLRERNADKTGTYDQISSPDGDPTTAFEATEVHRVYAWRDPTSCGPTKDIPCGIVVLDRDSLGLASPAFLGGSPFPITVPSRPVALIAGPPPLHPPTDSTHENAAGGPYAAIQARNWRTTTGVLAIPCVDGRVYWADLARWEVPSNDYEVNASATATGVSTFTPSLTTSRRVGLYLPDWLAGDGAARPDWSAEGAAASYVQVTPGFTPSEAWTVTYQGYLPDFATGRAAELQDAGGGRLRVALQFRSPGAPSLTQVVDVFDPAHGVRLGDIVQIWTGPARLVPSDTHEALVCPDTTTTVNGEDVEPIEGKVVSVDPPDAGHPGGSLVVEPGDCVSVVVGTRTVCDAATHGPWSSKAGCWAALPTLKASATSTAGVFPVRIRAGGGTPGAEEFVVVGATVGYAGRAVSTRVTPPVVIPTFTFTSEDEEARVTACPLLHGTAPASCGAACREACERLAIARRARRTHLTSVTCHGDDVDAAKSFCQRHFGAFDRTEKSAGEPFPPPVGPTLAFSLAIACPPEDQAGCAPVQSTASTRGLVRDARLAFSTRSGWTPSSRWGGGGNSGPATQPMGGVYFDRTADTSWGKTEERYRFFVPYVANMVLDVTPSQSNGSTRVLR